MKLTKKLRSRRGLTLTETLVTLLIVSLVSGAVVTGVSSASKVYRQSVALSESHLLTTTLVQAISDELRFAKNIAADGSTFTSATFGNGASFSVGDEASGAPGQVLLKGSQLLGPGAYSTGTDQAKGVKALTVTWDEASWSFQVELTTQLLGTQEELQTTAFSVSPLNHPTTP